MNDHKALFDYWYERVQLKNYDLIKAADHIPTYQLRHECTNYDELRSRSEVQTLEGEERDKVIAVIKYECTAKALQFRAGYLKDKANQLNQKCNELDQKRSLLLNLIKTLQEKLFGKDNEVKKLETRIALLEAENQALQVESAKANAYTELLNKFDQLEKKYAVLAKRKAELARNNMSLGGRVAHTNRFREQRDQARAIVKQQEQQIAILEQHNKNLNHENERLRKLIQALQQ